jgi:hypothetical protein
MSTEQKDTEQNALAARLGRAWTNFKQGKLISYKMMAILLILVAGLGTWWYISSASKTATSQRWVDMESANTPGELEALIKREGADAVTARIAELQLARLHLGRTGLSQFDEDLSELRQKAVENVEKARDELAKLLDNFKDDLTIKAQCLWGLAMAEEGLVGVPKDPSTPTGLGPIAPAKESKGSIDKLLGYLDQVAALQDANPKIKIPWSEQAKKRAEMIRKDPDKFRSTALTLFQFVGPSSPKTDPKFDPIAPKKN